jgi:hypothetical protein
MVLLAEEHHLNIFHDSLKSYMSLAGFCVEMGPGSFTLFVVSVDTSEF